jgi:MFS family permease
VVTISENPSVSRYAWSVLAVLAITNVLSFMDRLALNLLGQPIKESLRFADWQLGLLTGLGFATTYTLLGLPLARLAETRNRVTLISLCTLVWSAMTALCGLATNFIQILLFRVGVGVGEAGCVPAAHSLIADYFPPQRRATALAVFGAGIPLGALIGSAAGGVIVDHWGWRAAFMVMGLPGVLFALVVKALVREAPRGALDPNPNTGTTLPNADDASGDPHVAATIAPRKGSALVPAAAPSAWEIVKLLWRNPTAFHVIAGLTSVVLIGSVSSTFLAPFLIRKFGLSYTQVGLIISVTYLIGGIGGNLAGGMLSDWAGRKDKRWYVWVPAIGIALSIPLNMIAYAQSSWMTMAVLMFLPAVLGFTYLAPGFAILHNMVEPRMRATMIAIVQLLSNLIGAGLGPLFGGITIDLAAQPLFARYVSHATFATSCPGGTAAPGAGPELVQACHQALVQATSLTMIGWMPLMLWPALHFWLAARTVRRDARF